MSLQCHTSRLYIFTGIRISHPATSVDTAVFRVPVFILFALNSRTAMLLTVTSRSFDRSYPQTFHNCVIKTLSNPHVYQQNLPQEPPSCKDSIFSLALSETFHKKMHDHGAILAVRKLRKNMTDGMENSIF